MASFQVQFLLHISLYYAFHTLSSQYSSDPQHSCSLLEGRASLFCLRTALALVQNLDPDYLGTNKKGAFGQGERGRQLSRKKKQQIEGPRSPEQDHYPGTKSSTEVARGGEERNRLSKKGRKELGWEGG